MAPGRQSSAGGKGPAPGKDPSAHEKLETLRPVAVVLTNLSADDIVQINAELMGKSKQKKVKHLQKKAKQQRPCVKKNLPSHRKNPVSSSPSHKPSKSSKRRRALDHREHLCHPPSKSRRLLSGYFGDSDELAARPSNVADFRRVGNATTRDETAKKATVACGKVDGSPDEKRTPETVTGGPASGGITSSRKYVAKRRSAVKSVGRKTGADGVPPKRGRLLKKVTGRRAADEIPVDEVIDMTSPERVPTTGREARSRRQERGKSGGTAERAAERQKGDASPPPARDRPTSTAKRHATKSRQGKTSIRQPQRSVRTVGAQLFTTLRNEDVLVPCSARIEKIDIAIAEVSTVTSEASSGKSQQHNLKTPTTAPAEEQLPLPQELNEDLGCGSGKINAETILKPLLCHTSVQKTSSHVVSPTPILQQDPNSLLVGSSNGNTSMVTSTRNIIPKKTSKRTRPSRAAIKPSLPKALPSLTLDQHPSNGNTSMATPKCDPNQDTTRKTVPKRTRRSLVTRKPSAPKASPIIASQQGSSSLLVVSSNGNTPLVSRTRESNQDTTPKSASSSDILGNATECFDKGLNMPALREEPLFEAFVSRGENVARAKRRRPTPASNTDDSPQKEQTPLETSLARGEDGSHPQRRQPTPASNTCDAPHIQATPSETPAYRGEDGTRPKARHPTPASNTHDAPQKETLSPETPLVRGEELTHPKRSHPNQDAPQKPATPLETPIASHSTAPIDSFEDRARQQAAYPWYFSILNNAMKVVDEYVRNETNNREFSLVLPDHTLHHAREPPGDLFIPLATSPFDKRCKASTDQTTHGNDFDIGDSVAREFLCEPEISSTQRADNDTGQLFTSSENRIATDNALPYEQENTFSEFDEPSFTITHAFDSKTPSLPPRLGKTGAKRSPDTTGATHKETSCVDLPLAVDQAASHLDHDTNLGPQDKVTSTAYPINSQSPDLKSVEVANMNQKLTSFRRDASLDGEPSLVDKWLSTSTPEDDFLMPYKELSLVGTGTARSTTEDDFFKPIITNVYSLDPASYDRMSATSIDNLFEPIITNVCSLDPASYDQMSATPIDDFYVFNGVPSLVTITPTTPKPMDDFPMPIIVNVYSLDPKLYGQMSTLAYEQEDIVIEDASEFNDLSPAFTHDMGYQPPSLLTRLGEADSTSGCGTNETTCTETSHQDLPSAKDLLDLDTNLGPLDGELLLAGNRPSTSTLEDHFSEPIIVNVSTSEPLSYNQMSTTPADDSSPSNEGSSLVGIGPASSTTKDYFSAPIIVSDCTLDPAVYGKMSATPVDNFSMFIGEPLSTSTPKMDDFSAPIIVSVFSLHPGLYNQESTISWPPELLTLWTDANDANKVHMPMTRVMTAVPTSCDSPTSQQRTSVITQVPTNHDSFITSVPTSQDYSPPSSASQQPTQVITSVPTSHDSTPSTSTSQQTGVITAVTSRYSPSTLPAYQQRTSVITAVPTSQNFHSQLSEHHHSKRVTTAVPTSQNFHSQLPEHQHPKRITTAVPTRQNSPSQSPEHQHPTVLAGPELAGQECELNDRDILLRSIRLQEQLITRLKRQQEATSQAVQLAEDVYNGQVLLYGRLESIK